MTRKQSLQLSIICFSVLILVAIIVALVSPEANTKFKDTSAAIAFITGAAIGIERIIETFWTMIGGIKGTFWPLNTIGSQVDTYVESLNNTMKPFHENLTKNLEKIKSDLDTLSKKVNQTKEEVERRIDEGVEEIKELNEEFQKLKDTLTNTPKLQQAELLAAAAVRNAEYLQEKYGDLIPYLSKAERKTFTAVNGLQDFLASFKDNPARRLISLYFGAIIGLVIAGIFGLDLFSALLEDGTQAPPWFTNTKLTLIATGLVIGAGSTPTHEIIRFIQENKERQKGRNAAQPNLPTIK